MSVSTMKRLTVFAFRQDVDRILRGLMNLRCVEIRTLDASDAELALERLHSEEDVTQADRRLSEIRAAIPVLTKYSSRRNGLGRVVHELRPEQFRRDGSEEMARRTVSRTLKLQEQIQAVAAEQTRLLNQADALLPWLDYDAPLNDVRTGRTVTLLGSCTAKVDFEALQERLTALGAYSELVSEDNGCRYFTVTCLLQDCSAAEAELASVGFIRADFGDVDKPAQQAYTQAEERREALEEEQLGLEEALRDLAESLDLVEILCDLEETERTAALLRRRLAQTESCAVLDGWIPSFTQDRVGELLAKFECAYELEDPAPGDEPPVLLRNNHFAVNFEWVVGMYAYPVYGRFDPTFIMSIFYFLLFGLMFADVGYGLLLTVGCFGGIRLLNPRLGMRRMLTMFGYCGISATVMGIIFGGWFGDLPTAVMQNLLGASIDTDVGHFFGSGFWFNPLEEPMTFLIFSLAVGGVHLIAGMAVKLVILCRDGRAGEAVCTIVPYWVLFGGLITLLFNRQIGLLVSAVGGALILLLYGYGVRNPIKRLFKGLGGLYSLVSYASDLLSYSRILALALVAAVIAKVINMITLLGSTGVVGAIVMVIVLIAGHLLNLAINVLGSFVHTSRLQYLEFFGKFYEDGGKPFEPAAPADQYTEQVEL